MIPIFSLPDCTVGARISLAQQPESLAGFHRRSGIASQRSEPVGLILAHPAPKTDFDKSISVEAASVNC
jgi:hypothetical protein